MKVKESIVSFGSYISYKNDKRINYPINVLGDTYSGCFFAGGYFEQDVDFNIMLLNNFKQVNFPVDGKAKAKVQNINIKMNTNKNYVF